MCIRYKSSHSVGASQRDFAKRCISSVGYLSCTWRSECKLNIRRLTRAFFPRSRNLFVKSGRSSLRSRYSYVTRAETSFPFSFLSFLSLSFYHPLVLTGETFEARFTFGALSIHFKSFVCRFETIFCQCIRDASPLQFPDERKLGN